MPTNDPSSGRLVWAQRLSEVGAYLRLAVHTDTTMVLFSSGRLAALGEFVGLIHQHGVLAKPTAIFRGLQRPMSDLEIDSTVYIYVAAPSINYTLAGVPRFDGAGPQLTAVPTQAVFTTFVSFEQSKIDDVLASADMADQQIEGAILYWEWTNAAPADLLIPENSDQRYGSLIWRP